MMYAQSKGIYYVQVSPRLVQGLLPSLCSALPSVRPDPDPLQLEDDIVAKPNYLSTMKNFALQQPSEDWMILEFSQLGFIGARSPPIAWPTSPLTGCPSTGPSASLEPLHGVWAISACPLWLPLPKAHQRLG